MTSRLRYLWLTLAVVILDRATKAWFESQTPIGWRHELIPNFIYLVHSRNPGIAFGVLSDSASIWTRIILIAGLLAVISALAWLLVSTRSGGKLFAAGIALLLGGAAGNLTDRIAHGGVTDFFEVLLGLARVQRGRLRHHHRRDSHRPRPDPLPAPRFANSSQVRLTIAVAAFSSLVGPGTFWLLSRKIRVESVFPCPGARSGGVTLA